MEILKVLTLSTTHITEDTSKKLDRDPDTNELGLCVYNKSSYGWFIYIDTIPENTIDALPEDLRHCILLTKDMNCEILCLDCDGQILDYLKTYEW